jgi:hypothetical protein
LAKEYPDIACKNMSLIFYFGRVDDLYCMVGTPAEKEMFEYLKDRFDRAVVSLNNFGEEGVFGEEPYYIFKWLKSENSSSKETRKLGTKTRKAFGLSSKEYRQILSKGRKQGKILERIMSDNEWDKIDFSKIPSKAGIRYQNAFYNREETKDRYLAFANNKKTKVNADTLYPYEIVHRVLRCTDNNPASAERLMLQKYWENLPDLYEGKKENAIAVVDVSGSMLGLPMEAAISLGAYIAEKSQGAFANHFITFSSKPAFVEFKGIDITQKVRKCLKAGEYGFSTNIEAVFDLLLSIALKGNVKKEDIPERLYILTDMEFDECMEMPKEEGITLIDTIAKKWSLCGYKIPKLVFWNLNARHNLIPSLDEEISYVSGFSPNILKVVLTNKCGYDLMLEELNKERYNCIRI